MKKFIVIDGLDGSGKDTQSKFIFETYKNKTNNKNNNKIKDKNKIECKNRINNKIEEKNELKGKNKNNETIGEIIILRSHPETDNYFGKKAHKALLKEGKFNKIIATIFYAFDVIRSLILYYNKSDVLIFSRYLLAVAYFPKSLVKPVYKFFNFILPTSDFMFYLNIPPETAMERISFRNINEKQKFQSFENLDSLSKSREKINLISHNWINIDGSRDENEIRDEIESILFNI